MKDMTSPLEQLQEMLKHKDNNPLKFIQVRFFEMNIQKKKDGSWKKDKKGNPIKALEESKSDILFYINIHYCCFSSGGWGPQKEGTIEEREKWLMDTFNTRECILIYAKYDTLKKFIAAFDREMHWINQTHTRIERFKEISKKIFKHIESSVEKAGGLESYVEKHKDSLIKSLPANPRKIELDSMNRIQLLNELSQGRITTSEADELIRVYEAGEYERNSDKLCPFSGNGFDAPPKRICSLTGNPKVLGNCGSCRVAAVWEEAYG